MSKPRRYVRFVRIGLTEADDIALASLPKDNLSTDHWWLKTALSEGLHAYAAAEEEGGSPYHVRLATVAGKGRRSVEKADELKALSAFLDSIGEESTRDFA